MPLVCLLTPHGATVESLMGVVAVAALLWLQPGAPVQTPTAEDSGLAAAVVPGAAFLLAAVVAGAGKRSEAVARRGEPSKPRCIEHMCFWN